MRLECAPAVHRLDGPVPNLHLFVHADDACHHEHEARGGERIFEYASRLGRQLCRVVDERYFALLIVTQREVAVRLRPWEALSKPHRDWLAVGDDEQPPV